MKPTIPMTAYKARRDRLLEAIGDAILILPANSEQTRNRDCHYPFRQDSDFLYLSGFDEPDAIMVLNGKTQQATLFSKPYDELHAIWEGEIIGQTRACKEYLFDAAHPLESFDNELQTYFYLFDTLISPFSRYADFDARLLTGIKNAKDTRRARAPQNWLNSDQFIHPMRLIKDEYEQAMMQYAANISADAHAAAMAATQAGMNEAAIAAQFDYHFGRFGGAPAYGHIVAGGNNACTLHYKVNNCELRDGDLLLIDAGCEIDGYASDITRTFPVNGRFSDAQKRVYEWVLKAMQAALDACKAGNSIRSPHFAAEAVLIDAVIDLGLASGTPESVKADKLHEKYFMHGTSHWMGLDVHDVGDYRDENGEWLTLQAGMSLTVEPGLYIREDDDNAPEALRGIGVRIEDDVIITEDGHINLTGHTPKTVADVEAACYRN
ncbi:MAG: Xaa-Pro aminopeptidase [Gammaproteobacteria bacterium]|nr:MAG: Xaa-Pro aminopeptidase [Gammaproteobacteria bacterium]